MSNRTHFSQCSVPKYDKLSSLATCDITDSELADLQFEDDTIVERSETMSIYAWHSFPDPPNTHTKHSTDLMKTK